MPLWAGCGITPCISSAVHEERRNGCRSGESKLLSGDEAAFLVDAAVLGWNALLASNCNGAKFPDVSIAASLKLLSVPLADSLVRGSRDSSAGNRPLLSGLLLLSDLGTSFPPPMLSWPIGTSCLAIGFRILDFFLACAAAFDTSSAFRRASVQGLIFTVPVLLLAPSSSFGFLLPEFCGMPISGGMTSNCAQTE
uniref:Uncharacterized protein n=1 Tax=Oryza brachyantha TaxID=4533 RepID=J3LL96_ORYBR